MGTNGLVMDNSVFWTRVYSVGEDKGGTTTVDAPLVLMTIAAPVHISSHSAMTARVDMLQTVMEDV